MIETEKLSVASGTFRLAGIDLVVPTGKYAVLMGRTGCGKTTLLEAICGLKPVLAGQIRLGHHNVTRLKSAERGIGFVPQDGALFQTMTVRAHLEFALRIRRWNSAAVARRVDEVAQMMGLTALLDRRPHGLSGGESQRVALGRALSFRPQTLCLDEPLSALDDQSRQELITLLKRVQQETGVTALHVTHNGAEAAALADCRLQLADGQVQRVG